MNNSNSYDLLVEMDWILQLGFIQFYQDGADVFQFAVDSSRPFNDYVNNFILYSGFICTIFAV